MDEKICNICGQKISLADKCKGNGFIEFSDGKIFPSLSSFVITQDRRCPICNVKNGMPHHPGCSIEVCPRCGDSLVSCSC